MAGPWSSQHEVVECRDLQANAMAVDCTGQLVLLAGRRFAAFINLSRTSEVKKIQRNSKWDVIAAQWNPHRSHSNLFVTACNQRADIFSWEDGQGIINQRGSLKAHTRVISDVDWSPKDPNLIATCSGDTFTCIWDVRSCRKPSVSLQAVAGASQVKWNKVNCHQMATTQDGDIRIWDQRKGTAPVQYIAAHLSKIHGLDWDPNSEVHLATSSQDCTVKFWDVTKPKHPEGKLPSGSPVWRARYTPFGAGLVTVMVPQLRRGENSLFLWHLGELQKPVHTFVGHMDVVLEFQWRAPSEEIPDYQLVTWSKDQSLRLWRIETNLQKLCGEDVSDDDGGIEIIVGSEHDDGDAASNAGASEPVAIPKVMENGQAMIPDSPSLDADPQRTNGDPATTKDGQLLDVIPSANSPRREELHSLQQPKTLLQEFTLINVQIPNVEVEEMDPIRRICTVRVDSGPHVVRLNMYFPETYPSNAAPSFQLSKGTNIEKSAQAKIIKVLQDTSLQHVKHNRSCIEPCLRHLVASLSTMMHDKVKDTMTSNSAYPLPPHPTPIPAYLPIYSYGAMQDAFIPFPRTCGARFCGGGFLVCFTRKAVPAHVSHMRRTSSAADTTPRAMSESYVYTESTRAAHVPPMRGLYGMTQSPPTGNPSVSLSSYYNYKDRNKRSRSKSRARENLLGSNHEGKKPKIGPVIIYSVSGILPVSKQLAENYVLNTGSIQDMCLKNAGAAAAVSRKDLAQVWSLASLACSSTLKPDQRNPDSGAPWAAHPFGRRLVTSLLAHYSALSDVQSLAMLCCVFGSPYGQRPLATPPASRTSPGFSPHNSSASDSVFLSPMTEIHYHTWSSSSSVSKIKRSNSWAQMCEDYKFEETKDPEQVEREKHEENCRLLSSMDAGQHDHFKTAYAEILYRWDLLNKRAEVLKHVSTAAEPHKGIEFNAECCHCQQNVRGAYCWHCKNYPLQCAICHITVKGASSFCLACGHGGHATHMMNWFRTHTVCPTGCGCNCLDSNCPTADVAPPADT